MIMNIKFTLLLILLTTLGQHLAFSGDEIKESIEELGWKSSGEVLVKRSDGSDLKCNSYIKDILHKTSKGEERVYEGKLVISTDNNLVWLGRSNFEKFILTSKGICGVLSLSNNSLVISDTSKKLQKLQDDLDKLEQKLKKDISGITKFVTLGEVFGKRIFLDLKSSMSPPPQIKDLVLVSDNLTIELLGNNGVSANLTLNQNLEVISSAIKE